MTESSKSRRSFLQTVGAAALMPAAAAAADTAVPTLPTVKFGKYNITRMIVGSNPFYGYSHFNGNLDGAMREYYTQERKMEVLRACEQQGVNTWQVHYNDQPAADFKRYRAEGGRMQLVLLADFALMQDWKLLPGVVASMKPMAIGHHGNRTDERFRTGQKQLVKDFCKAVRDTGVMVGISTHNPAVVDTVESEGWDIDYYQTCLYRVTRTAEEMRQQYGEASIGEIYMEKDPERMCKMIRQTRKPCLAFKLFGAGRTVASSRQVESSFTFAFNNIKPGDAVIVGFFPKFKDEVRENTGLVRKILAGARG
jgi:hypothetical protein